MVSINGNLLTDRSEVYSRKIVDMLHNCAQEDASVEKCSKSHKLGIQINKNIASNHG